MNFPYHLIDLTHTLSKNIPSWDGSCGYEHQIKLDYGDKSSNEELSFRVQQIKMSAGIGTHLDAPAHCVRDGLTIEQLPLEKLTSPVIVIDVSDRAHELYSLSVNDIEHFEIIHGKIPPLCFVIVRTGWEKFWTTPERYSNEYRFPSISKEAAYLLLERMVVGVGIDTLSPDRPESGFPVHKAFLESGKYIIENVANAGLLPATGAWILALPLKIKDGTEAPLRLVGLLDKK